MVDGCGDEMVGGEVATGEGGSLVCLKDTKARRNMENCAMVVMEISLGCG